jgi:pyruvate carboxylase
VPEEVKAYVRGLYGKPPAPIDFAIQKKIIGDEETLTIRPADKLAPGLEKAAQESEGLAQSREDVLSYALFPQVAKKFFLEKEKGVKVSIQNPPNPASKEDPKMNLQEIKELPRSPFVYQEIVDDKGSDKEIFEITDNGEDIILYYKDSTYSYVKRGDETFYGKRWRCWSRKPTIEEAATAPWIIW